MEAQDVCQQMEVVGDRMAAAGVLACYFEMSDVVDREAEVAATSRWLWRPTLLIACLG